MKQGRSKICMGMVALLLFVTVIGCTPGSVDSLKGKLRIVAEEDIHIYHAQGLRDFKEMHPLLEIEFVNIREVADSWLDLYPNYARLVAEQQPDVVIANGLSFPSLVEEGHLLSLEPLAIQDQLLLENMVPAVEQWLRDKGRGQLYGLAPFFERSAIYYRSDLFDLNGIPYPQNQMSWQELLALAQQFPATNEAGERLFGFHDGVQGSADYLIASMGNTSGLAYLDWDRREITLDADGWRHVYELAVAALRSGSIYDQAQHGQELGESSQLIDPVALFREGRIAMLAGDGEIFSKLTSQATAIPWEVVTQPVDPQNRLQAVMDVDHVYAISAASVNVEAAWALVTFMNNRPVKPYAGSGISAWRSTWNEYTDREAELAEVWGLLDNKPDFAIPFWEVPQDFHPVMAQIRQEGLAQMLSDEVTVEEALQHMEKEGQAALEQALRASSQ